MRFLLILVLAFQVDPATARVLEKVRAARPSDDALAVYRHDWAPTWEEARARSRKEKRPILLVVNTNITGPTNFYTGHC